MKKDLTKDELKAAFIKSKQNESLDCPTKIEDFILPYLSESEQQELRKELEEWVAGEEEFVQQVKSSVDLDTLWQEQIAPGLAKILSFPPPSRQRSRITAAKIVKQVFETGKQTIYEILPIAPQLQPQLALGPGGMKSIPDSNSKVGVETASERPTSFQWRGGELDGMRLQITPMNRVVIDFGREVEEGIQISFVDTAGQEVQPQVCWPLDQYGRVSYDLENLPSREYTVIIIGCQNNHVGTTLIHDAEDRS